MITVDKHPTNLYLNWLVVVLAFSIPVYRKWVVFAAPLIILLWFFEGRLRAKLVVLRHHRLTLAVLLFILFNLLSLLWSGDPVQGLSYLAKYRYLLLIPVIVTSLREPFRDRVRSAFLVGVGISLAVSYAVYFGLFRIGDAYPGNPAPTMSHLDYSMVLAVAALMTLNHLLHTPLQPKRSLAWGAFFLFVIGGLFVNISRSGQAAFAGTLLIMLPLVLARRSRRAAAIGLAVAIASLILGYLVISPLHQRVNAAIDELRMATVDQRYDTNQGKRLAGMIVALHIFGESPVLGTGAGDNMNRFHELLDTEYRQLKPAVHWYPHLHNQYLQVATEIGVVGLLLMLNIFVQLVRGPYSRPDDRNLAVILCGVYLIGFIGDPFLHKQLPLVLFAVAGGVISAMGRSVFWDVDSSA